MSELATKECVRCGARISTRSSFADHWKTATCKAAYLRGQLRESGLTTFHDDFTRRVLQGAGVETRREETGEPRRGRKKGPESESWAPAWMVEALSSYWVLTNGFSTDEVVPFYVRMIKQMATNEEYREAVNAVVALNGKEGLRNFVLDARFRASKLRKEAAELSARVARLVEEADSIDPPADDEGST